MAEGIDRENSVDVRDANTQAGTATHLNGTAGSTAAATRKVVVVLGMHRSGTSVCMHLLNRLGVRIDEDLLPADAYNEKGYFECRELVALNDQILASLGAVWHTIFSVALQDHWMDHPSMVTARRQLAALIREKAFEQPTVWGFKDPRLNILLPLYEQAFADCGVEPVYVICLRDPRSVASSLQRIHNFPRIFAELLWIDNTMSGIRVARKRIGAVVHYENWFRAGQVQLQSAMHGLGLEWTGEAPAVLENTVERALNHGEPGTMPFALPYTESIYGHLKEGDYEAAASEFAEIQNALKFARLPGKNRFRLCWRAEHEPFAHARNTDVWIDIDPGAKSIRLDIPPGDWTGLRLDLGGRVGLARFFALRVLNQTGQVLWDWNGQPESLARSGSDQVDFLSSSAEPGVIVHFSAPDAALELAVLPQTSSLLSAGGVLELEFAWLVTNSLGGFDFSRGIAGELAAVRSELEALRRELTEKTAEASNCWTAIASQQQELAAHQKKLAVRTREADLSRDHVNALSAEISGYQAEKRDVLQSWSWRLTAPLRRGGSLFRR